MHQHAKPRSGLTNDYRCIQCHRMSSLESFAQSIICNGCGASYPLVEQFIPVFLDPTSVRQNYYGTMFGSAAKDYDKQVAVDAEHSAWVLTRLLDLEPPIRTFCNAVILEIGAGTGLLTRTLASGRSLPFRKLYVSDLALEMLLVNWRNRAEVERKEAVQFAVFNILKMPLYDASIDIVIGFDALHHVLNYPTGLKEIARVLAPGGVCILKEPHRDAYRVLALLCKLLVRMDFRWQPFAGLTKKDRLTLETWEKHFFRLLEYEEIGNHEALAKLDDKYYLSPRLLERHALSSGFGRFSECNFLRRERNSDISQETFCAPMLYDFFRGIGISRRGLHWLQDVLGDLDFAIGDKIVQYFPINSLFLFWK
jgi:ubiquinone/menaquinone biosynthesis C-methylase UbiE